MPLPPPPPRLIRKVNARERCGVNHPCGQRFNDLLIDMFQTTTNVRPPMLLLLLLIRSMIRQIEIGAPICNLPYSGKRCQPGGRCMPPGPAIPASTLNKKHLSWISVAFAFDSLLFPLYLQLLQNWNLHPTLLA